MGKTTGFKDYPRKTPEERPPEERTQDYRELYKAFPEDELNRQAARCMNCGVPFCHIGCPLGNIIPDWNDLVYRQRWEEAIQRLHATNNFPEFTGRLCPAPCEEACVLGINEPPVTIELIEKSIIEHAFERGLVKPQPPEIRTGKRVAVVGSGPSGLACAQQLNRAGHTVTVFERADRIGGLLRYGIPDFKLEKRVIDRRVALMEEEGIAFVTGASVGSDAFPVSELDAFDAVVLCGGATKGRDLPIPGRELGGIHFAMDFLPQQNRTNAGDQLPERILATDKHVVVIGGGDTGSDCIGTSIRQGAKSVVNFELLSMPPEGRPITQPWPFWPMKLRTSSSHEEGSTRYFSILSKAFIGGEHGVRAIRTVNIEFVPDTAGGRPTMRELPGTEHDWRADLVLLALGFVGPERDNAIAAYGLDLDARGNVKTDANYMTSRQGIFAAGDMRRGQSLIVWAISEGREAARGVDMFLMGRTNLPTKGPEDLPRV
jgi:glutamate synthase (NADPH/NADH) small chain